MVVLMSGEWGVPNMVTITAHVLMLVLVTECESGCPLPLYSLNLLPH